ncbi:MAG: class I SAM-dependent methyltransferase [Haliscomenobacter sp.]|nr:class I SAM-dependent methyltransferase [Haliscomenobacter sp.]
MVLTPEFIKEEFPYGIDFITIDGDHTFEGCLHDLESVAPFLAESGVIVVDDYMSGPPNGVNFESVTDSVNHFLYLNHDLFEFERWNVNMRIFV